MKERGHNQVNSNRMEDDEEEIFLWELDSYEFRCSRRLEEELGINRAGTEVILHMRNQIQYLQERVRQLEIELAARHAGRQARLSGYHEYHIEAHWYDFDRPEETE